MSLQPLTFSQASMKHRSYSCCHAGHSWDSSDGLLWSLTSTSCLTWIWLASVLYQITFFQKFMQYFQLRETFSILWTSFTSCDLSKSIHSYWSTPLFDWRDLYFINKPLLKSLFFHALITVSRSCLPRQSWQCFLKILSLLLWLFCPVLQP